MAKKYKMSVRKMHDLRREGKTPKEIAKISGYTVQNVYKLLKVGRKVKRSATGSEPINIPRKINSAILTQQDLDFLYKYDLQDFIRKSDIEQIEFDKLK